jgi:hypothetical protein
MTTVNNAGDYPALEGPSGQNIWRNDAAEVRYSILPGHVSMHPSTSFAPTAIRFIAPDAGYYKVRGQFGPGDNGVSRRKAVIYNGVVLLNEQSGGSDLGFTFGFKFAVGDIVDFQVDNMWSYGNTQIDATFSLMNFSAIGVSEARPVGDTTVAGTVILDAPAPAGGVKVRLESGNSAASVQSSVIVPEGSDSVNFDIVTHPVSANTPVNIFARFNGQSIKQHLVIVPPHVASLDALKTFLKGGTSTTGFVTLDHIAGPAGETITLTSLNPTILSVPASVLILPGHLSGSFTINTSTVAVTTKVKVVAKGHGPERSRTFTVKP